MTDIIECEMVFNHDHVPTLADMQDAIYAVQEKEGWNSTVSIEKKLNEDAEPTGNWMSWRIIFKWEK